MSNTAAWDKFGGIPKNFCAYAVSFAKTVNITGKISAKMKDGVALAEVLISFLPMTEKEVVRADAEQLIEGVNNVYAEEQPVDMEWLEQRMNKAMAGLDKEERAAYVINFLALVAEKNLGNELKARIEHIKEQNIVTEEDAACLIRAVKDVYGDNADLLTRSDVLAMDGVYHILPTDRVKELGNAREKRALARAGAYYVLNHFGENAWSLDWIIDEHEEPYNLGVIAGMDIEDNRFLSLYYNIRIRLVVLKARLRALCIKTLNLAAVHAAEDEKTADVSAEIDDSAAAAVNTESDNDEGAAAAAESNDEAAAAAGESNDEAAAAADENSDEGAAAGESNDEGAAAADENNNEAAAADNDNEDAI